MKRDFSFQRNDFSFSLYMCKYILNKIKIYLFIIALIIIMSTIIVQLFWKKNLTCLEKEGITRKSNLCLMCIPKSWTNGIKKLKSKKKVKNKRQKFEDLAIALLLSFIFSFIFRKYAICSYVFLQHTTTNCFDLRATAKNRMRLAIIFCPLAKPFQPNRSPIPADYT